MANARVFLSDLKFCRCFSTARNIRRGDELMSVDMLLLDSNVTTKSYITSELTAIKRHVKSYFYNFFTNDTGNTSAASLLRGFSKVEPMKIAYQKKDGATSWTLEITRVGSVSLSAKMFGGGNEKENNSGSKTSTGLILKKAQATTSAKVNIITELAKFSRADVRNLMASCPILDEAAQNTQPTGIQPS
ncbi:hypothetical protein Bca52824_047393 [Brassica carinata]|uniref:Uncharacterized protein n=1 Tax=Brassica carinata TaxID=52824 RepID=A0A8X7UR41_BRACI|nr:hypothetical protein Bca52824_047393 [Brassica carinata]